jgi:hypothetical protein
MTNVDLIHHIKKLAIAKNLLEKTLNKYPVEITASQLVDLKVTVEMLLEDLTKEALEKLRS